MAFADFGRSGQKDGEIGLGVRVNGQLTNAP